MTLRVDLGFDREHPIVSGNDLIFEGVVYADEAMTTPRDLTGVSAFVAGIFNPNDTSSPLATIELGDGITILNAALGAVRYRFAQVDTRNMAGIYLIQGDITDGSDNLSTPFKGRLRLEQGLLD